MRRTDRDRSFSARRRTAGGQPLADRAGRIVACAFRPLALGDLGRVHAWLHEADVARWYSAEPRPTRAAVERKYGRRIRGDSPTRVFVLVLDGRDAGIVQRYRYRDYPSHADEVGAAADWVGIDYLIGSGRFRGRGLSAAVIDRFVVTHVFTLDGISACAALPAADNARSIRTLRRAGFAHVRDVELEPRQVDRLMLRLERDGAPPRTKAPGAEHA